MNDRDLQSFRCKRGVGATKPQPIKGSFDFYKFDPDTQTSTLLANAPYSPDLGTEIRLMPTAGGQVAALTEGSGLGSEDFRDWGVLYMVSPTHHTARRVAPNQTVASGGAAVLPDGRVAVATHDPRGGFVLSVYDPHKGSLTPAGKIPRYDGLTGRMTMTPTTAGLVVIAPDNGPHYLMNPAARTVRRIALGPDVPLTLDAVALPDGRVAFRGLDREFDSVPIRVYDPKTGAVGSGGAIEFEFAVFGSVRLSATTGGLVAVEASGGGGSLYVVDPAARTSHQIAPEDIWAAGSTALSDGRVGYWSRQEAEPDDWRVTFNVYDPRDGSAAVVGSIPDLDRDALAMLTATSAGQFAAVVDHMASDDRLYLVDPAAGTVRPLDAEPDHVPWPHPAAGLPAKVQVSIEDIKLKANDKPGTRPDGSVYFKARVKVPELKQEIKIGVYWATGPDKVPDLERELFADSIPRGTKFGLTKKQFKVPKEKLLTAPPDVTALVLIADPAGMKLPDGRDNPDWIGDRADVAFSKDDLTPEQLRQVGLSAEDAARYAGPLNDAMREFGIQTPEQRAMFLAQVAHESARLRLWVEGQDPRTGALKPPGYFINLYWKSLNKWELTRPQGSAATFKPTDDGLYLQIPHAPGATTKSYQLYWAKGPTLADSATLIGDATFTYQGGTFRHTFPGADPATLPKYTTHLLVVDPDTFRVETALKNRKGKTNPLPAGNWRPADVVDF